jgi:hypothetical protein
MATDYSSLKTEVADYMNRNDLTSFIDGFIDLAEAEMQRELKLLEFETTGTVSVTSGSGTLPTGFLGARTLNWDGNPKRVLKYLTPDQLETINVKEPSYVSFYTITGSTIKFANDDTGTLNITYMARFTPLSGSATTNAIITNHPGAYLAGSLKYAAIFCKDLEAAQGYQALFNSELRQIISDNKDRKYAGATLQVRPG